MESTGEALMIHCSDECKKLLDSLGGYLYEDRGEIPIKGKGVLNTYWLIGEVEDYKIKRYQARADRRASKNSAKLISKFLQTQKDLQKSSLKSAKSLMANKRNRLTPFSSNLIRSTSFDSPKKLRFAFDIYEKNFHTRQLHYSNDCLLQIECEGSNDALVEVITDKIATQKREKSDDSIGIASTLTEVAFHPTVDKEITKFIRKDESFREVIQKRDQEYQEIFKNGMLNKNTSQIQITSVTPLLSDKRTSN